MKTSDSLAHLAPALVKAQAHIKTVVKDATNPHFRSTYATLDQIIETVRPVLAAQGLAVVQGGAVPHTDEAGRVTAFGVESLLVHTSGEYISTSVVMPLAKADPQGAGGALTYGRRYGLSALLCLATDEDDDGNVASNKPLTLEQRATAAPAAAPKPAPAKGAAPLKEVLAAAKQELDLEEQPNCPKCGGEMWDNRPRKAAGQMNPKAPDFKCRAKDSCDGVIWPPKPGQGAPARAAAPKRSHAVPPETFNDFPPALEPEGDDLPF